MLSLVFWEQQGLQTFGQRIQITRPQASQPAFERHFAQLNQEYGYVHAINLLGSKENEATLTAAYDRSLRNSPDLFVDNVNFTNFDFHNMVKMHGHDSMFSVFRCVCCHIVMHDPDVGTDVWIASWTAWIRQALRWLTPPRVKSLQRRKVFSGPTAWIGSSFSPSMMTHLELTLW